MSQKERILIGLLLSFICLLTAIDVYEDFEEGTELRHLGLDLGIALASLIAVVFLVSKMRWKRKRIELLTKQKMILQDIAEKYKEKSQLVVKGLSTQIDEEFTNWGLSHAEREVALLLLKGLSNTEIAEVRQSAEKTVRHQSTAVYKKAGLKGRGELQAYFLEDLL